jgi:hypothetical protein
MDNKEINLKIITNQYRKRGAAAKGFRTVNTLLKKNEIVSLRILLRNHIDNPIDSYLEVEERDNVDFLIDYFSILEIGLIANYFPNPLPLKTEKEIDFILNNELVNRYFTEYYPLTLPQLLLRQVSKKGNEKYFNRDSLSNSTALFDRFLMLNQIVKNDEDIDQLLWFFDDGWTADYSISDFWNVLSDRNIIKYKLGSSNKHPLNSALWGFVKYIQFLSDFADLLRDSKEDAVLQSAFWHHQSYWFEHMKERIGDIIKVGISNIRQSLNNLDEDEIIGDKNSFLNSKDDISKWQSDTYQLKGVEADINYLLNSNLGEPLKSFLNDIN